MRVQTPLLADLARGVETEQPVLGERIIEVPPLVIPYVCLPLAHTPLVSFSVTDRQRTSFFQLVTVIRTNQAELQSVIATFGQGLWYLHYEVWYKSNFDAFTASGNGMTLRLADPAGSVRPLIQMEPVNAPEPAITELSFPILMTDDGWTTALNVFTTGVGQTSHAKVALQAVKLL